MGEKKRTSSRLLACVAFVALVGLAVSCGEEQPSGDTNGNPDRRTESAAAPATTTPAQEATTRPEETTAAPEPKEEKTANEEAVKEEGPAKQEAPAEPSSSEQYGSEQYSREQYDPGQDAEGASAPSDPTMYLSVPKLGISGALVIDGEAGLETGAEHLPGTGYPWLAGSNTYIAGHRVGFPGTGSDRIFYDLPAMAPGDAVTLEDANGKVYSYAVSEVFAVTPYDTWVTGPTGADTVTLQVCTETPDDWWTIGPSLMASGPESGRLIVRANRVA